MRSLASLYRCGAGPRTLCLMLEAVKRAGDVRAAAKMFHTFWEQAFSLKVVCFYHLVLNSKFEFGVFNLRKLKMYFVAR